MSNFLPPVAELAHLLTPCLRRVVRAGFVWALSVAAVDALGQAAFVTASSVHGEPYLAENAADGDLQTRWASRAGAGQPEWLQVDLGEARAFDEIVIHWEAAFAVSYEIQVSDDGRQWRTVRRKTDGQGGKEVWRGLAARGRFVRILCLKTGPFGLYSIWEVEFPEPHVAAALRVARQTALRERERQMNEVLERVVQAGAREIIFAARPVVGEHWYANFGYYAARSERPYFGVNRLYRDGGKLYRLGLASRQAVVLLDDPAGGIRDPQVHYDGRKILFSYRRGGSESYHLYTIHADGGGLTQLTDGPFDDIEPAWLPDGGIVFVSSRGQRWVNCWTTQVAILHRCDGDGRHIHALSSNNEHDNTPWVLPDGRLLYTRWEYVDRSQVDYHHLWTANPDGTGQSVFFGNQRPGTVLIDAKPIPGTEKIVASFSPGHGQTEHAGFIGVVDPKAGPDAPSFARVITREADYRDPWALSEEAFLAARGSSIVLLKGTGESLELFRLPAGDVKNGFLAHEPRLLGPRERERLVPARTDPSEVSGRFFLANVNEGRRMEGVKPGQIKKLLVLETLPKPINFTGGMEPLSYGGTFTLERILGTVPVEADGSACFEAPALRSLFFVALDEDDVSVKRMQSFTTVMPGESVGCVGCHEHRVKTPVWSGQNHPLALARPPSRIEPIPGVPDVLSFPRDIQPILDRHCLKCHDCEKAAGGVTLSGDRGPHYSLSYFALTARNQVADGRNRPKSNYPPRALGSGGSALLGKLDGSHHEVKVSPGERQRVRLWIDSGAPYPGTYAALGCGMIGGYDQNNLDRSAEQWPVTKAATLALRTRCASCHAGAKALPLSVCDEIVAPPWEDMAPADPRRKYSRHLLYNLTRPAQSRLLLAPLSKQAGGLELCVLKPEVGQGTSGSVFRDVADADYAKVLAAIRAAQARLEEIKRFDMPGFRPRPEWVREMKRYGICPASFHETDAVDVREVEQRYWRSLWPKPGGALAGRQDP